MGHWVDLKTEFSRLEVGHVLVMRCVSRDDHGDHGDRDDPDVRDRAFPLNNNIVPS